MRLATSILIWVLTSTIASAAMLELNLAADLYEGGADFEVLADDTVVGKGTVESAEGDAFQFEVLDNATQISVRFTNDAAGSKDESGVRSPGTDRNLVIVSASWNGRKWPGTSFDGEGTFTRNQKLVLARNTTVTMPLAASTVEVSAPEQEQEPSFMPEPKAASEAAAQSNCAMNIAITGYTSGVVNLSPSQQELLAPTLQTENCKLTVTGYSSTSGPTLLNEQVALNRAQAVLDFLIRQGVSFTEQEAVSAGETNEFGPTQADNRRVVVQLN